LKFIKEEGLIFGSVRIEGLSSGHYQIKLKEFNRIIPLKVHIGTYWETDSFILKQHQLVEMRESANFIRIKNLEFSQVEETKKTRVSFKLSDFKSNP